MAVLLTDALIRAATTDKRHGVDLSDTRCPGLSIRIGSSGVKTWCFKFRHRESRRVERLTLGRYPAVSLARARELADKRRSEVAEGGNPRAAERRRVAAERAAMTFDELAELYLNERVARQTPKSLAVVKSFLTGARQHFGTMKAKDIARADVIAYLREKAKAAPVAANRTRSIMSTLFAWAMDEGHVDTTPMIRIPKPATEQPKDRIIHDDELPLLWKAFDKLDASFAGAFRTLALLGQRPGEIAGLEVGEVYNLHDPEKARIELPADRVKNARRHVVPLPPRARQIIADAIARKQEHDDSPFVFPSFRNPGEAIDRHSFARAMVRLIEGLDGDDAATARLKAHRVTPHDFRRSMVTKLIELEFGRDLVKLLVNHAEGDITERHYDRASRLHERRRALEAYERHVLSLLGEAPTNRRVVALRGGRKA